MRVLKDGLSTRGAEGLLGTVRHHDGSMSVPVQVEMDEGGDYSSVAMGPYYRWSWFNEDALELVTPRPIRTVTRREIVPGTYGRVRIFDVKDGRVWADSLHGFTDGLYADELREAALIFNEIADVLEENADTKEAA
ncbi:MAG TPA: hypothetical protein VFT58_04885 [Nitrososphaera sp.]|nr:hypothetical protein [Nitrososphaera sp.]